MSQKHVLLTQDKFAQGTVNSTTSRSLFQEGRCLTVLSPLRGPRAERHAHSHTRGLLAGLQRMRTPSSSKQAILSRTAAVTQASTRPLTPPRPPARSGLRPPKRQDTRRRRAAPAPARLRKASERKLPPPATGQPGAIKAAEHRPSTRPSPALPPPAAHSGQLAQETSARAPRARERRPARKAFLKKALKKKSGRKRQVPLLRPPAPAAHGRRHPAKTPPAPGERDLPLLRDPRPAARRCSASAEGAALAGRGRRERRLRRPPSRRYLRRQRSHTPPSCSLVTT